LLARRVRRQFQYGDTGIFSFGGNTHSSRQWAVSSGQWAAGSNQY
jgi:hypothetical protein